MTVWRLALVAVGLAYAATGFYVVGGDEQAVVRRFGRAIRTADDQPALRGSGLHCDLPWPFSRVDRIRLNEVRTMNIGLTRPIEQRLGDGAGRDTFPLLTGDRNLLIVRIEVQYRVSAEQLDAWLYSAESAEERLRLLVEAEVVEAIAASGVDFAHTFGRSQLQDLLTVRARELAERQRLGVDIELVAIEDVQPPSRVKAAFLDVSDARADRDKYINAALTAQQQRKLAARSEAREIVDRAESERRRLIEEAGGAADAFMKLVERIAAEAERHGRSYAAARQLVLRRRYFDTMQQLLSSMAGKVFLDSGQPVDLTIQRDGNR